MTWLLDVSRAAGNVNLVVGAEPEVYNKVKFSWIFDGVWHSEFIYLERTGQRRREGSFLHFARFATFQGAWERLWSSTEFDFTDRDSVILYHFHFNLPSGSRGHGRSYPDGIRCLWEVVDRDSEAPSRPVRTIRVR